MKIRKGFVSNSSTSSFCIIGVRLEMSNQDMCNRVRVNHPDKFMAERVRTCVHDTDTSATYCSVCGKEIWEKSDYETEDFSTEELLEYLSTDTISAAQDEEDGREYVGFGAHEFEAHLKAGRDPIAELVKALNESGLAGRTIEAKDIRVVSGTYSC